MRNWQTDSAFVVVVTHGAIDISRTTWTSAVEAERHMAQLREQGFSQADIRLYRARLVRPPFYDS